VRVAALFCLLPLVLLSYGLGREFVARVSFAAGISSMETGDLERARIRLGRSVSTSSLVTEGFFWLATVELQLADRAGDAASYAELLESARDHADVGLEAYPTEEGLLLRAGIALRMSDFERVDDTTARLLESNPGKLFRRDAQILRASADARRGEVDRAKTSLRELIGEEPEYVHGYLMLASILRQEGDAAGERGVYEEAVWAMQAGVERIEREYETADRTTRSRLDEERAQLLANLNLFISSLGGLPENPLGDS
jgi:tetratricopeptide (TPR) repeat protein